MEECDELMKQNTPTLARVKVSPISGSCLPPSYLPSLSGVSEPSSSNHSCSGILLFEYDDYSKLVL